MIKDNNTELNIIKPINTPKGWASKKEFIDDDGNVFYKGKFSHNINKVEIVKLTNKDIYNQFIIENIPFRIFFRNELLFDTKTKLVKEYPIFNENDFILSGKNYIYRGIRIERY